LGKIVGEKMTEKENQPENLYEIGLEIARLISDDKILQEFRDQCKYFVNNYNFEYFKIPDYPKPPVSFQTKEIMRSFFPKPEYSKQKIDDKLNKAANFVLFSVIHDKVLLPGVSTIINNGIWDDEDFHKWPDLCLLWEIIEDIWENTTIQKGIFLTFETLKSYFQEDTKPPGNAVDDKELTIITELADGTDKTCSQVEIEAATSIKRGTVKDKLIRLEKIGLVHRPLGKRKGYQITDKGREIAKRNQ
jgi:hypothetical protein